MINGVVPASTAITVAEASVTFPLPAPVALTNTDVSFDNDSSLAGDGDASCTGSANDPTAPPGKVCIYPGAQASGTAPRCGSSTRSRSASAGSRSGLSARML